MSTEYLKLGLDILILIGLGGFMYYALRLSKALNVFKTYRKDFEHVMNRLSMHIDEAHKAIDELKDVSAHSGTDLRKTVKDAQFLVDDLKFMTEAGNKLADRLEIATGNGKRAAQNEDAPRQADNVRKLPKNRAKNTDDDFVIHDREIEDENAELNELASEAERELYKALKNAEGKKK